VTLSRTAMAQWQTHPAGLPDAFGQLAAEGVIQVEGNADRVVQLLQLLEEFEPIFNVVEP